MWWPVVTDAIPGCGSANNQEEGTEKERQRERKREKDRQRIEGKNRKTQTLRVVARRRLFTVAGSNVWQGWVGGRLLQLQITQDQRTIPRGTLSRSVPNSTSVDRTATRPATPSWRRVAIPPTVAPPRSSWLRRDIAKRGPRPKWTISFASRFQKTKEKKEREREPGNSYGRKGKCSQQWMPVGGFLENRWDYFSLKVNSVCECRIHHG